MNTEIFGQVPIYSRQQIRKLYAKTVKANFSDPEQLVEVGVIPFPTEEEMERYDESVKSGLQYALESIEEGDVADLPDFFMIDTKTRDGSGRGNVWVIADGSVVDFTRTRISRESEA